MLNFLPKPDDPKNQQAQDTRKRCGSRVTTSLIFCFLTLELMSSALKTKEFLEFQQTLRDLESQVRKLLKEAAESGPSERTKDMTEKVYDLAQRANQTRPQETRNQSTTNQSILEKLPRQFDEDFGK